MGSSTTTTSSEPRPRTPSSRRQNYFFPDGDIGSLILVTTVGVLDTADDTDEAEQLIEFLLSKEAQKLLRRGDVRVPARRAA